MRYVRMILQWRRFRRKWASPGFLTQRRRSRGRIASNNNHAPLIVYRALLIYWLSQTLTYWRG